jgi:hypothetical protein
LVPLDDWDRFVKMCEGGTLAELLKSYHALIAPEQAGGTTELPRMEDNHTNSPEVPDTADKSPQKVEGSASNAISQLIEELPQQTARWLNIICADSSLELIDKARGEMKLHVNRLLAMEHSMSQTECMQYRDTLNKSQALEVMQMLELKYKFRKVNLMRMKFDFDKSNFLDSFWNDFDHLTDEISTHGNRYISRVDKFFKENKMNVEKLSSVYEEILHKPEVLLSKIKSSLESLKAKERTISEDEFSKKQAEIYLNMLQKEGDVVEIDKGFKLKTIAYLTTMAYQRNKLGATGVEFEFSSASHADHPSFSKRYLARGREFAATGTKKMIEFGFHFDNGNHSHPCAKPESLILQRQEEEQVSENNFTPDAMPSGAGGDATWLGQQFNKQKLRSSLIITGINSETNETDIVRFFTSPKDQSDLGAIDWKNTLVRFSEVGKKRIYKHYIDMERQAYADLGAKRLQVAKIDHDVKQIDLKIATLPVSKNDRFSRLELIFQSLGLKDSIERLTAERVRLGQRKVLLMDEINRLIEFMSFYSNGISEINEVLHEMPVKGKELTALLNMPKGSNVHVYELQNGTVAIEIPEFEFQPVAQGRSVHISMTDRIDKKYANKDHPQGRSAQQVFADMTGASTEATSFIVGSVLKYQPEADEVDPKVRVANQSNIRFANEAKPEGRSAQQALADLMGIPLEKIKFEGNQGNGYSRFVIDMNLLPRR